MQIQNSKYERTIRRRSRVGCLILFAILVLSSGAMTQPDTMYIEIDYMVLRDTQGNIVHSHEPRVTEINAVKQMFACQGIVLVIDVDDELPHIDVIGRDPADSLNMFNYYGPNSFGDIKTHYKNHWLGWHYCVFAHRYQSTHYTPSGSSGLSEIGGDDFIVSLGGWGADSIGTAFERAATLAHEFGHNLGLRHTGIMEEDVTGPHTPNLPSTMSYLCQLAGIRSIYVEKGLAPALTNLLKEIDYSHGRLCPLVESSLDERLGVGMKAVDWNCNGHIDYSFVDHDLARDSTGGWCLSNGTRSALLDFNEWNNIEDNARKKSPAELQNLPVSECVTLEERNEFFAKHASLSEPDLQVEPCVVNEPVWAAPGNGFYATGVCGDPYIGFLVGYAAAPAGDILYLRYGSYDVDVPSILLNKPLIITTTHTAVIRPVGKKK